MVAKAISVNAVAVPQQVFRCGVEGKRFDDLLCCPCCRRMSRNVEMNDLTAIMPADDEPEQDPELHCRDREEVDRNNLSDVIVEKRPSCLRRWFDLPPDAPGDGGFRDIDAELQEFAVYSRRAPSRIRLAHHSDQLSDLSGDSGSAGPWTTFP